MAGIKVQVALTTVWARKAAEAIQGGITLSQPTDDEVRLFGHALSQSYISRYEMSDLCGFLDRFVRDLDREIIQWNMTISKMVSKEDETRREQSASIMRFRIETKKQAMVLRREVIEALALSSEVNPIFEKYFRTPTQVVL